MRAQLLVFAYIRGWSSPDIPVNSHSSGTQIIVSHLVEDPSVVSSGAL